MVEHKERNTDKGNGFGVQFISENTEKANTVLQRYYKDCKDNAVCVAQRGREVSCLPPKRTDYGKQIRKDYEAGIIAEQRKNIQKLEPRNDGKTNCLTSVQKHNLLLIDTLIRRLTPIECERLQTVPDNYTAVVSDTQRYRMLGNGWTVEVIKHILNNLKV